MDMGLRKYSIYSAMKYVYIYGIIIHLINILYMPH